MIIPNDVHQVVAVFKQNGYNIYAVGGQVRDWLIGNKEIRETLGWCNKTIRLWKKEKYGKKN